MAEIVLTGENFRQEVLESNVPVLVDFWATWCMPCRMLAPIVSQIAEENEGKIKVGKVDVDENGELAASYGINSIPCLIVFKNGQVANQSVGVVPKAKILELIG